VAIGECGSRGVLLLSLSISRIVSAPGIASGETKNSRVLGGPCVGPAWWEARSIRSASSPRSGNSRSNPPRFRAALSDAAGRSRRRHQPVGARLSDGEQGGRPRNQCTVSRDRASPCVRLLQAPTKQSSVDGRERAFDAARSRTSRVAAARPNPSEVYRTASAPEFATSTRPGSKNESGRIVRRGVSVGRRPARQPGPLPRCAEGMFSRHSR
jgi:hypothetical protein